MYFKELELPSNRKFGYFFTFMFLLFSTYFYFTESIILAYLCISTSLVFLIVTVIKSDALHPLNKLWMRFGLLLGMIVSPIVLGIIFLCLFTPVAICLRLLQRDELRLKFSKKSSHWVFRNESIKPASFKHQF